jgi:hypothetical protein
MFNYPTSLPIPPRDNLVSDLLRSFLNGNRRGLPLPYFIKTKTNCTRVTYLQIYKDGNKAVISCSSDAFALCLHKLKDLAGSPTMPPTAGMSSAMETAIVTEYLAMRLDRLIELFQDCLGITGDVLTMGDGGGDLLNSSGDSVILLGATGDGDNSVVRTTESDSFGGDGDCDMNNKGVDLNVCMTWEG